jgi:ribosomal protein L19E
MDNTTPQTAEHETSLNIIALSAEDAINCDKMSHLTSEKLKELFESEKKGKHSNQRGAKGAFGSRGLNRKNQITNLFRPNKQSVKS